MRNRGCLRFIGCGRKLQANGSGPLGRFFPPLLSVVDRYCSPVSVFSAALSSDLGRVSPRARDLPTFSLVARAARSAPDFSGGVAVFRLGVLRHTPRRSRQDHRAMVFQPARGRRGAAADQLWPGPGSLDRRPRHRACRFSEPARSNFGTVREETKGAIAAAPSSVAFSTTQSIFSPLPKA